VRRPRSSRRSACEALKARAIVRDEDDRPVLGEKFFEPRDRLDVEMIRRLVEEQQVWLRDERAREQDAAAPSSRQRVDDRIGWQRQPVQDQLDPLLELPAAALLQLVLQPPEPLEQRRRRTLGNVDRRVVVRAVTSALISSRPSATTSKTGRLAVSGTSCTSRAVRTPG
jgi:hypothetical protein